MSKIISGSTEVTTTGTPVPLTTGGPEITAALEVQITCDASNVGTVCVVGDKNVKAKKTIGASRGIVMEKKQAPIRLETADPSQVYVDAEKSGDYVNWIAVMP
jgi:hypothetical protein